MMKPNSRYSRSGSIYVAALGAAMIITVVGVSALTLARVERTSAQGISDLGAARFYAQSAIEMGQHYIRQNPNWRQTYPNGVWEADRLIGTGTYTLEAFDPVDGNLSNSPSDPLVLRGTGFEGQSRYKLQVRLVAKASALTCLQVAMHAGTNLSFISAQVQSNAVTISANDSATANSSNVYTNVQVVNTVSGTTFRSATTTGIPSRTMPGLAVFDHYILNGTPVLYSAIVSNTIERIVLSPNSNPYGAAKNSNGVYVIDCLGGNLRIRNARIVGTLVILNPGLLTLDNSIHWAPAVANYPSLLVRGNLAIGTTNGQLTENSGNVNYNPPGTPYNGESDGDASDAYPSIITGLVYASGNIATDVNVTLDGVLVSGNGVTSQNNLALTYRSTFYDNPPPGFTETPEMVISLGTWKQLVD